MYYTILHLYYTTSAAGLFAMVPQKNWGLITALIQSSLTNTSSEAPHLPTGGPLKLENRQEDGLAKTRHNLR